MVRTPTRRARSGSAAPPTPPAARPRPRRLDRRRARGARSRASCSPRSPLPPPSSSSSSCSTAAGDNPQLYAQHFFLSVPLTDATHQPPLAVNGFLTASARPRAGNGGQRLLRHTQPHHGQGAQPMARDAGYPLSAQFPTTLTANNIESITAGPGLSGPRPALELLLEDLDANGQPQPPRQPHPPAGHNRPLPAVRRDRRRPRLRAGLRVPELLVDPHRL